MSEESAPPNGSGPASDPIAQAQAVAQRPEVAVDAAFVGAFLLAKLIKRLGR